MRLNGSLSANPTYRGEPTARSAGHLPGSAARESPAAARAAMLLLRRVPLMLPIRKRWFFHVVEICQELSAAPRPWIEPASEVLTRIQRVTDPSRAGFSSAPR